MSNFPWPGGGGDDNLQWGGPYSETFLADLREIFKEASFRSSKNFLFLRVLGSTTQFLIISYESFSYLILFRLV